MKIFLDYFEEILKKYPNKNAFVDANRAITFSELDKETKCVAQSIINMKFNKTPIMVFLDKSVEAISAYFGVARSGNISGLLDVNMPSDRVLKIFEEVKPKLVITDYKHLEIVKKIVENSDIEILIFEVMLKAEINEEEITKVESTISGKDIIALIYTSGSTGIPKGVIIPHSYQYYYIEWQVKRLPITSDLICGDLIPMYYSLWQWYFTMTIAYGITTYLIPQRLVKEPSKLMQYLYDNKVSMFVWVPMMYAAVSECGCLDKPYLPELKIALFCGEAMPGKIMNDWRKVYKNTRFFCMYTSSECISSELLFEVKKDYDENSLISIGNISDSENALLINFDDKIANKDELAEIYLKIFDETYGYYNDSIKTANAFVTNPTNTNDNFMYFKTGDIVKVGEEGEIKYISRADSQIKFMGNRINLGEIEAAAKSISAIEECMATFNDDKKQICMGYVGDIAEEELLSKLENAIPKYMVPKKIVKLDVIPKLPNGKIDRMKVKALFIN